MKRFNHLQQCLVLFGLCLLGAVIGELSPVSVPGSVVGMVLLFVCLMTGIVKVEQVEDVADFLQKNMAFFFVPMCANILEDLAATRKVGHAGTLDPMATGLLLLGVCVFCTVITFAITGFTVTLLQKLMNGKEKKR